jgi:hypothetical protein
VYGAGITAGTLAIARFGESYASYGYSGWDDYAARNGIVCRPGTYVRGQDGLLYVCHRAFILVRRRPCSAAEYRSWMASFL